MECISKGKAHKRFGFGVKASVATTSRSNILVGDMTLPGNLFDVHTLVDALVQVCRLTGFTIDEVYVDRGYRGYGEKATMVYISGQRRVIKTQRLRRSLKRRQAIEPVIGSHKSDGLPGRNHLKGTAGDQMNVMLSCTCHNLWLIPRQLGIYCLWLLSRPIRVGPETLYMGRIQPVVHAWPI